MHYSQFQLVLKGIKKPVRDLETSQGHHLSQPSRVAAVLSVPAQAHLQQDSRPEAAGSHNSWNGRSLHGAGQQEKEGREEQEPQGQQDE